MLCLAALAACTAEQPAGTAQTEPAATAQTEPAGTVAEAQPNAAAAAAKGQDPNIRATAGTNVPGATVAAQIPASKQASGAASKGADLCTVHFDNRTDLHIATYVDGNSAGVMGPWGDVYAYAIAGPTRMYARADFTDGSVITWGPTMIDCPAGSSQSWLLRR